MAEEERPAGVVAGVVADARGVADLHYTHGRSYLYCVRVQAGRDAASSSAVTDVAEEAEAGLVPFELQRVVGEGDGELSDAARAMLSVRAVRRKTAEGGALVAVEVTVAFAEGFAAAAAEHRVSRVTAQANVLQLRVRRHGHLFGALKLRMSSVPASIYVERPHGVSLARMAEAVEAVQQELEHARDAHLSGGRSESLLAPLAARKASDMVIHIAARGERIYVLRVRDAAASSSNATKSLSRESRTLVVRALAAQLRVRALRCGFGRGLRPVAPVEPELDLVTLSCRSACTCAAPAAAAARAPSGASTPRGGAGDTEALLERTMPTGRPAAGRTESLTSTSTEDFLDALLEPTETSPVLCEDAPMPEGPLGLRLRREHSSNSVGSLPPAKRRAPEREGPSFGILEAAGRMLELHLHGRGGDGASAAPELPKSHSDLSEMSDDVTLPLAAWTSTAGSTDFSAPPKPGPPVRNRSNDSSVSVSSLAAFSDAALADIDASLLPLRADHGRAGLWLAGTGVAADVDMGAAPSPGAGRSASPGGAVFAFPGDT